MSTIQPNKQHHYSEKRFSDLAASPVLYWTLVFITLVLVIAAGMYLINWSFNARLQN